MRANKINAEELFKTNDIIHGFGEVPAVTTDKGVGWILPGRVITHDKKLAEYHAKRMDVMIQANMKRYKRDLIW